MELKVQRNLTSSRTGHLRTQKDIGGTRFAYIGLYGSSWQHSIEPLGQSLKRRKEENLHENFIFSNSLTRLNINSGRRVSKLDVITEVTEVGRARKGLLIPVLLQHQGRFNNGALSGAQKTRSLGSSSIGRRTKHVGR